MFFEKLAIQHVTKFSTRTRCVITDSTELVIAQAKKQTFWTSTSCVSFGHLSLYLGCHRLFSHFSIILHMLLILCSHSYCNPPLCSAQHFQIVLCSYVFHAFALPYMTILLWVSLVPTPWSLQSDLICFDVASPNTWHSAEPPKAPVEFFHVKYRPLMVTLLNHNACISQFPKGKKTRSYLSYFESTFFGGQSEAVEGNQREESKGRDVQQDHRRYVQHV